MSSAALQPSASLADSVERISKCSRLRQRTTVLSMASSSSTQTITGSLFAMALPSARQPAPPAAAIGDALDLVERDQQGAHPGEPGLRSLLEACRYDISELWRQRPVRAPYRRDRRRG